MEKTCVTCREGFYVSPCYRARKNCSLACGLKWRSANRSPKRDVTTLCGCGCGTVIAAFHTRSLRPVKYVAGHSPNHLRIASPERRREFGRYARSFGSDEKKKPTAYRGSVHWNWKGGTTDATRLERQKFQKYVRPKIVRRDKFTCQLCGQRNGRLHVDHIKSWSQYPDLRFDASNCRTLCMSCHYEITYNRPMPENVIWGGSSISLKQATV